MRRLAPCTIPPPHGRKDQLKGLFQAVTAFSPIQFQKQVRLQQSRLLLMAGAEDVASIGLRVGYDSAPQFNREYRRHFGLPPGRDAARLRAAATSLA